MSAVSVIIPCSNHGESLPAQVESVRQQTAPPSELIVVVDGSTDAATRDVVNSLCSTAATILHTPHQGVSAARNFGIEQATGDYVLCLESDGVMLPTMLEELAQQLDQQPQVGIASPIVERFGDTLGVAPHYQYSPTRLYWQNCLASASLFRMQCWRAAGGYHDLPALADWELWISIVEKGWEWALVSKPLYRQRIRSDPKSELADEQRRLLWKRIVAMHLKTYQAHIGDIWMDMDAVLRDGRRNLQELVEANGEREQRIATLKKSLHDRDQQISELESVATNVNRMVNVDVLTHV